MTNPLTTPGPPLLMICPTRGRPRNATDLWHTWEATTTGTARLVYAFDLDDPALPEYEDFITNTPGAYSITGPRRRLVGTLNTVAYLTHRTYRYLGFLGDDHRPRTTGWDQRLTDCLSAGTGICYGNDLLQGEKMATAVAMTSDIPRTLGYMAPPTLTHLCADLVWMDWGRAIGRLTYLPDVVLEHCHPAAGKAPTDATYEDCNSPERNTTDAAAYYTYRDGDTGCCLRSDVTKLRALLQPRALT